MNNAVEVIEATPPVMDWREYQKTPIGSKYYPSRYSLQWHIRKNREFLIECGALIKMRGRDHIVIEPFEKAIIDIGLSEARRTFRA